MEWNTDDRDLDQEPVLLEDKVVIGRNAQGMWTIERTTVRDHTVRRTTTTRSSPTSSFREARRVANGISEAVYVRGDDREAAEAELTGPPPAPNPPPPAAAVKATGKGGSGG